MDHWERRSLEALADLMPDFEVVRDCEAITTCAEFAETFRMHPLLVPGFLRQLRDAIEYFGLHFVKEVMDDNNFLTRSYVEEWAGYYGKTAPPSLWHLMHAFRENPRARFHHMSCFGVEGPSTKTRSTSRETAAILDQLMP